MNAKQLLTLGAASLATLLYEVALAQEVSVNYVQVAEIEIDPAQLESYEAAVKEHIDTAIRVEPGVLVLYAVSEKITRPESGSSKCTPARTRTRRTWKHLTSRNTRR